jgi:hypothetical protein
MNISANVFDTNENFKMKMRRSSKATGAAAGTATGAAAGAGVGAGVGALVAGGTAATMSSSGNVDACPLNDDSFYCQLSRATNIISMIMFIIIALVSVIYFLYFVYIMSMGSSTVTKKSRR